MARNISWRTTKVAAGFDFAVIEIISRSEPDADGKYADLVTLKTGNRPTRAQAKGLAQRWVRYFKGAPSQ